MSGILGLLTALPQLIALIRDLVAFLNKISGNDIPSFIARSSVAFSKLNNSKTPQEHSDAAKEISNLIASMPK